MLSKNEARYAANNIVAMLREGYWQEDEHGTYLARAFGLPYDLAILINYGILERWERSLTRHQRYEWLAMTNSGCKYQPFLRNSDARGDYWMKNGVLKSAPILAESFARTLHALERLEVGKLVKLHWIVVQMEMELEKT